MAEILTEFREAPFVNLSFDWTDIQQGFTQVQYYGGQIADDSGNRFIMSDKQFDPWHLTRGITDEENSGRFKIYNAAGSDVSVADLDFDSTPFTVSRTLDGTATINVPFGISTTASDQIINTYVIATIYRVRSAAETSIGTATSSTLANANDGITTNDSMISVDVSITNEKFKDGDTLRVNLNIHCWYTAGSGGGIIVMTDPLARDVSSVTGSSVAQIATYTGGRPLSFFIPYKVDI